MGDDSKGDGGRGGSALRGIAVGLVALLVAVGTLRAVIYLWYAAEYLGFPLETHQLEAKMVLLAYRVQAGLGLYPEWRHYPHVANFFAPVDFLLVGGIGRLVGADLRGLFLIGRGVSFASGMVEAVVLGVWVSRKYGRFAGWAGAVLSLGSSAMGGFSVSTRPDMLAELLGVVGLILCGSPSRRRGIAGLGALVLAVFTKQTAGAYLVAAALAALAEGRRRWAATILGGGLGAIAVVVAGVTLAVEPHFARSLVGEAATPRDMAAWLVMLRSLAFGSGDLLLLPVVGLVLWSRGRDRDPGLAAMTATLLVTALVTSMKRGADVNYFLALRAPEAMAAAALWVAAREARSPARAAALGLVLAAALGAVVLSVLNITVFAERIRRRVDAYAGARGRASLDSFRAACGIAREPSARMLTDSGFVDLHAGDRAAFGDPWLFRMLVDTGRIDPRVMVDRIESEYYDIIITENDIRQPDYESNAFGLPTPLVGPIRRRYDLAGFDRPLYLYKRRGDARPGPRAAGRGERPPAEPESPRPRAEPTRETRE